MLWHHREPERKHEKVSCLANGHNGTNDMRNLSICTTTVSTKIFQTNETKTTPFLLLLKGVWQQPSVRWNYWRFATYLACAHMIQHKTKNHKVRNGCSIYPHNHLEIFSLHLEALEIINYTCKAIWTLKTFVSIPSFLFGVTREYSSSSYATAEKSVSLV